MAIEHDERHPLEGKSDQFKVFQTQIMPGSVPVTPIIWPVSQHKSNQIQQTKGSAKPRAAFVSPSTQPNTPRVAPRTTPGAVSNIRVIRRASGTQRTITVQFTHPPNDPYFAGASVYLRKAGGQPVLVSSGAKSPLSFVANQDHAAHAVYVSSWGNWGETATLNSPSHPVHLG